MTPKHARSSKQTAADGKPIISRVEIIQFEYDVNDISMSTGTYQPGFRAKGRGTGLKLHTNIGVTGEYVVFWAAWDGAVLPFIAPLLLGKNPLEREKIYIDLKRRLRQVARLGMGVIDIALWDLAGKYYNAPIYELLGGFRKKLPAYASTLHGDHAKGGLDTPEAFAEFAEQCLDLGYRAFKIHDWQDVGPQEEIAALSALRKRVGARMELMLDPACSYNTFADALKVGRACDQEGFFWYEDPFQDGGISQFAHRKLRHFIKTPILITEHVRTLEPKLDYVVADATDYLRGDPVYDGGITGTMKLAHAAEALGIDVELHVTGPDRRHCMAAMRNSNYYEMGLVHPKTAIVGPPVYACDYRDGLDAIDKDGCVPVPEGPGLGVRYDWDFIAKHCTGSAEFK